MEKNIQDKFLACLREYNKVIKKPVINDIPLGELAEKFKHIVYFELEDTQKEDAAIIAVSLFRDYLNLLEVDEDIADFIKTRWWEKIYTYLSMYTLEHNANITEVRMYNRIINYLKLKEDGQDPREIGGPELLTTVYERCKEVITYFENDTTIAILKSRLPIYFKKDSLEKQNGGYINARKLNALCGLLQKLDPEFTFIPFKTREDDVCETAEFIDIK